MLQFKNKLIIFNDILKYLFCDFQTLLQKYL